MNSVNSYYLNQIKNTNIQDLLLDVFDITWMNGTSLDKKEYTILPIENAIDDGSVSYLYNSDGFRSDDFKTSHNEKHILFAGCSNTEGVGSPLNTVWSKMLYDELSQKYKLEGFYSIARSGYGWQKIISNFIIYTQKYGFPSHLFILLPNITRFYIWKEKVGEWEYVQRYPEDRKNHVSKNEYFEKLIDFTVSWDLFEKYCEANNVKLLWSTWFEVDEYNLSKINKSKTFFSMNLQSFFSEFVKVKRPNLKLEKHDISRRDGHDGVLWHEYWLEKFKEQIEARELFND